MRRVPRVGLPADCKLIGPHAFHAVGDKYVRAVVEGAGCQPLLLPALGVDAHLLDLLDDLDGLLLTGAYSNIEPRHYSAEPSFEGNVHDPQRDATTLALIPAALSADVPILALCRGLQEVNVALGGSLHQKLQTVAGLADHREDSTLPLADQYGPAHRVELAPGGLLAAIAGAAEVQVNSLHQQGIRRLGRDLVVEATAPDGLVEAVRYQRQRQDAADPPDPFLLAVQWHPEWDVGNNPFYLGIFAAFGQACRERQQKRR